jgi:predicted Zn-dependent protease
VDASDSSITFDGSNTGDYVSGSSDTGSNWDDPTGSGGYVDPGAGYYGYGLTKWKNQAPSATQIANAEHSDSVYEGAKWADKTITWSFAGAGNGPSDAITHIAEQTAVEQAFQAWAKASGLNFDEMASGSKADIQVGFSNLDPAKTNEIGLTKYNSKAGVLTSAKVELEDPNQASLVTNASGQLAYANTDASFEQVALHEIGHALGLADTDMMGSIMNAVVSVDNQTLTTADIANVHKLYADGMTSNYPSPSILQVHQLVQAMSVFDASEQGIDHNPMAEVYLQKEHLLAGSPGHVRAA